MDIALIKPQKVRRVVRLSDRESAASVGAGSNAADVAKASSAGGVAEAAGGKGRLAASAEAVEADDVTTNGSNVEVADPTALRPRGFRADFVYAPPNNTVDDVAQIDLPLLVESVLAGTDATLLMMGADGAGQAQLVDGPAGDGSGSIGAAAVIRVVTDLHERHARHRQGGTSGYAYQAKLRFCQFTGERIDDLLTDRPEPCRVVDTEDGVVIDGLRVVTIAGVAEAENALRSAHERRRRDTAAGAGEPFRHRNRCAAVLMLDVMQADYLAGWGLCGRIMVIEAPALDVLAEDQGLVQLRDGFDSFRGLFHLRTLVSSWNPQQLSDVTSTTLTAVLRDALSGGSMIVTVLLCLQQGQPRISRVALEFLREFEKLETNPVSFDHRLAGFARAVRAERVLQQQRSGVGGIANKEIEADSRMIILELERRVHAAQRARDDAVRSAEFRDSRAKDLDDQLRAALLSEETLHERLTITEEEHLEACQGIVEMHASHVEAKDEMNEIRYKNSTSLALLEQEVLELHQSLQERRELGEKAESQFVKARSSCEQLASEMARCVEAEGEGADAVRLMREEFAHRDVVQATFHSEAMAGFEESLQANIEASQRELRHLRRQTEHAEDRCRLAQTHARQSAEAQENAETDLLRAQSEFHRSLVLLEQDAKASPGGCDNKVVGIETAVGEVVGLILTRVLQERRNFASLAMEQQKQLIWVCNTALDWSPSEGADTEKLRLAAVARSASDTIQVDPSIGVVASTATDHQRDALIAELECERQKAAVSRAAHARELRRRDAERAVLETEVLDAMAASKKVEDASTPAAGGMQWASADAHKDPRGFVARVGGDLDNQLEDLRAQNVALRARLERIEDKTPAEQRVRLQRLAFLEKSVPLIEAERSELLVRAMVAEEQLVQMQHHLKQLTESYQLQILNLKRQARSK